MSAVLAKIIGILSSALIGFTDERVTTTPTTRSRSVRSSAGLGGRSLRTARITSVAADAQMPGGCPVLVDGDLTRAIWRRQSAGQHPGRVEYMLEPAVGRCHYLRQCQRVQKGEWLDGGDARQPGQRPVAAQPGAGRRDQHVRRVRGLEKTRICAVGPPRPRDRGQDGAPGNGHQKREYHPAPPAGPKPVRG